MSTAAEKRYMNKVACLGCVVCRNSGLGDTPANIHHIRTGQGKGQRASNYLIIPLCKIHHQDGGPGVAIHADRRRFEALHGTELELLSQTIGEIAT